MTYYIRNSSTKICFYDEDFIIAGGRYNKKIKANEGIFEILKKTSYAIEEDVLLSYLNKTLNIGFDTGKNLISKLLKLGFIETNSIYSFRDLKVISKKNNKIRSLNIPTYLRPHQLGNCVSSYYKNFQNYAHYIDYYIFDDTPIHKVKENYLVLQKLKKDLSTNIFYVGLDEKEKFIELVAKECKLERKLIEFAFMPQGLFNNKRLFMSGSNRNFILAYTVGECFFMADDDSCCSGFKNNTNSNIYFSTGRGNINKQYIRSRDLENIIFKKDLDILNMHEEYIGKSLKEIFYDKKIKEITFDMLTPDNDIFPNNFNFYENSNIHFTFNTTMGWPDQTADELLYDYLNNGDIEYLLGLSNKTILEGAPGSTIYSNPFLLTTTLTGLDNTSPLCPFMPVYRNEDVHYSYFLNYLNPYSLSSCINVSLLHDKRKSVNQLESFYKNFYGDIVLSYILYNLLNRLKIQIPNEYVDNNARKFIFFNSIREICGKNQIDFTDNLINLNVDLNKLWNEKRELVNKIYNNFENNKASIEISEYFMDFNKFINNEEWDFMRRVLILYSDLLLEWENIMETCYALKLEDKLPKKII